MLNSVRNWIRGRFWWSAVPATALVLGAQWTWAAEPVKTVPVKSEAAHRVALGSSAVSRQVDELILAELANSKVEPALRTTDEDFLRRVTFDLAGTVPSS